MLRKLYTHAGAFHADEVLAIVTYEFFVEEVQVIRTFDLSEVTDNDIVLDIGREYNPAKNKFDHHQDDSLESSNILILNHVCENEEMKNYLIKHLYQQVSDIDRGFIKAPEGSFNSIIRNLNSLTQGFEVAHDIAHKILLGYIETAKTAIKGEYIFNSLDVIGNIAINPDSHFIPNWKELAPSKGVKFMAMPNVRGGWQLVSYDSDVITIPEHPTQTFRHNSGFMSVYPSRLLCIEHGLSI